MVFRGEPHSGMPVWERQRAGSQDGTPGGQRLGWRKKVSFDTGKYLLFLQLENEGKCAACAVFVVHRRTADDVAIVRVSSVWRRTPDDGGTERVRTVWIGMRHLIKFGQITLEREAKNEKDQIEKHGRYLGRRLTRKE